MADDLVITAIVADHISSTLKPLVTTVQHPNFTMVDMGTITWVVMGLGCLVLSLCVLLASILIYQHCRWTIETYFRLLKIRHRRMDCTEQQMTQLIEEERESHFRADLMQSTLL